MKKIFMTLLAFATSACGASHPATPTPTIVIISECFPSYDVFVWEDENGNGAVDEGERPLEGIPVSMYRAGTLDSNNTSTGMVTDADGKVTLRGIGDFGAKCDELDIAINPGGYMPTTPVTVSLIGKPYDYVAQFGLIAQIPASDGGSFVEPGRLAPSGEFFQACSLLEGEDLTPYLGAPPEFPLTSSGAIGENGVTTYDCMTDSSETALTMYYALAIESDSSRATAFFNEQTGAHPEAAAPGSLGDDARLWKAEDEITLHVSVLQGNVVLSLDLAFWLEDDSPEHESRAVEFARLILARLFERGG